MTNYYKQGPTIQVSPEIFDDALMPNNSKELCDYIEWNHNPCGAEADFVIFALVPYKNGGFTDDGTRTISCQRHVGKKLSEVIFTKTPEHHHWIIEPLNA